MSDGQRSTRSRTAASGEPLPEQEWIPSRPLERRPRGSRTDSASSTTSQPEQPVQGGTDRQLEQPVPVDVGQQPEQPASEGEDDTVFEDAGDRTPSPGSSFPVDPSTPELFPDPVQTVTPGPSAAFLGPSTAGAASSVSPSTTSSSDPATPVKPIVIPRAKKPKKSKRARSPRSPRREHNLQHFFNLFGSPVTPEPPTPSPPSSPVPTMAAAPPPPPTFSVETAVRRTARTGQEIMITDLRETVAVENTDPQNHFLSQYLYAESLLQKLHKDVNTPNWLEDNYRLRQAEMTLDELQRILHSMRLPVYAIFAKTTKVASHSRDPIDEAVVFIDELEYFLGPLETAIMAAVSRRDSQKSAGIQLPRLSVPSFSGRHADWPQFSSLFDNLTKSLADLDKLRLLMDSLQGSLAQDLVKDLQLIPTNWDLAWERLQTRYESPREIAHSALRPLLELVAPQRQTEQGIMTLLSTTRTAVSQIDQLLLRGVSKSDVLYTHLVMGRMDKKTLSEYQASLTNNNVQSLQTVYEFLEKKARDVALAKNIQEAVSGTPNNQAGNQAAGPQQQRRGGGRQPPLLHVTPGQSPPNQKQNGKKGKGKQAPRNQSQKGLKQNPKPPCVSCKETGHPLYKCPTFTALTASQRKQLVFQHKLCLNCLTSGHGIRQCKSNYRCQQCKGSHHSLLHGAHDVQPSPFQPGVHHIAMIRSPEGLLPTALVEIRAPHSSVQARCLLDTGAQGCYVSHRLVEALQLTTDGHKQTFTLAGQQPLVSLGTVTLTVVSLMDNEYTLRLSAHVLNSITTVQPDAFFPVHDWQHLEHLALADPSFNQPGAIELIIGMPAMDVILGESKIPGIRGLASAYESQFGWIVMGAKHTPLNPHILCHITPQPVEKVTMAHVHSLLQKFWELDTLPSLNQQAFMTKEEQFCEEHFAKHTIRLDDGRYQIKWPFTGNTADLGSSLAVSTYRWISVERKLLQNPQLHAQYTAQLQEYLDNGEMEMVAPDDTISPVYYIPHHGVIKESSATSKLRIVFDASAATSSKLSLNSLLPPGPVIQNDLFRQLLHFREHAIAIKADIARMYRQIRVHPDERDLQRIVWRPTPHAPLRHCRMACVPFGVKTAPYIACKTLQHLAESVKTQYPVAASILSHRFYMDDLTTSISDLATAQQVQRDLVAILASAGFPLRKWASNSAELMAEIPPAERETGDVISLDDTSTIKTLGIIWSVSLDAFAFTCNPDIRRTHTKRVVLSETSKIFDPLGLISPITTKAKILMQRIWMRKLEWDDQLPADLSQEWLELADALSAIDLAPIPRVLNPVNAESCELHGFCDASKGAYAAVIYMRAQVNNEVYTNLITSKTRVAPLNPLLTIPRLELQSAVLLVNLMNTVRETLSTRYQHIYYWTDAAIVLHWLNAPAQKWQLYVANRVATIQESAPFEFWGHVRSEDNPADCASRGVFPHELRDLSLWWKGPTWLMAQEIVRPPLPGLPTDVPLEEHRRPPPVLHAVPTSTCLTRLEATGSWHKSIRILARISAIFRLRTFTSPLLQPTDIVAAEHLLVMLIQQATYPSLLENLDTALKSSTFKSMRNLRPFLLDHARKTLHVGGRLEKADLPFLHRHPFILPGSHPLVRSLLLETHISLAHAGKRVIINTLRDKFWIVNGTKHTKAVLDKCLLCFRYKAQPTTQLMGQLPSARIHLIRPFLHTGVDYAGPYHVSNWNKRGAPIKVWIALFSCMATRAIHLELVSTLSADGFLLAFRRFIARRGKPSHMYSDRGTNFVAANKHLQDHLSLFLSAEERGEFDIGGLDLAKITWTFSPPLAPHHGGVWEVCVRLVKTHLKTQLLEHAYTWEQLETTLLSIEAIVNSRPLTPTDEDPDSLEFLTPGHFLIGSNLLTFPEADLSHLKLNRLSRYQLLTRRFQDLWRRWQRDYLSELQRQQKWLTKQPNLQVGDMVLLLDELAPPLRWKVGRIQEVHPASDSMVRVVTVRTAACAPGSQSVVHKDVLRAISKVARLPFEQQPLSPDVPEPDPPTPPVVNLITTIPKTPPVSAGSWIFWTVFMTVIKPTVSQNPLQLSPATTGSIAIFAMFFALAGCMANVTSLVHLLSEWRYSRRGISAYKLGLLSLSCSDLIIAGLLIPFTASRYAFRAWCFGITTCRFYCFLLYGTVTWTFFNLVGIAFLRYYKFVSALHRAPDPIQWASFGIPAVIVLSYLLPLLALTSSWGRIDVNPYDHSTCTILPDRSGSTPKLYIWLLGVSLPFLFLYTTSIVLYIAIRRSRSSLGPFPGSIQSLRRLRVTMTQVLVTFLVGYQPMLVLNCWDTTKTNIAAGFHLAAMFLAWTTTIIHPLIYITHQRSRAVISGPPPRVPPTPVVARKASEPISPSSRAPAAPPCRTPVRLAVSAAVVGLCLTPGMSQAVSVQGLPSVIVSMPICPGFASPMDPVPTCTTKAAWLRIQKDATACIFNLGCTPPMTLNPSTLNCEDLTATTCKDEWEEDTGIDGLPPPTILLDKVTCQTPHTAEQDVTSLRSLAPDFCAVSDFPLQPCTRFQAKTQAVPVLLIKGIMYPVKDLHITENAALDDINSYNCSCNADSCLNSTCQGDTTFCENIGCLTQLSPGTTPCYCRYGHATLRHAFTTPTGSIFPDCWGHITTIVKIRATALTPPPLCAQCAITCTLTGIEVHTPGVTAKYIRISKNPGHISVAPTTDTTDITLTTHMLTSQGDTMAEIWLPFADVPVVRHLNCPRIPICQAITCHFCKDRWVNVICYDLINWALVVLSIGGFTLFILTFRYVFHGLYCLFWLILWPCRTAIRIYLRKKANKAPLTRDEEAGYPLIQLPPTPSPYHRPTTNPARRHRFTWPGGRGFLSVMTLCLILQMTSACSEFASLSASTQQCHKSAGSETCTVQVNTRLSVSPVGQTSCFKVTNNQNRVLGTIEITTATVSITCDKRLLYYVPRAQVSCQSYVQCYSLYASSDCHGDKCENFGVNDTVPALASTKNSLGWSTCLANRYPTCAWILTRDCHFIRSAFINPTRETYEVFNCPEWRFSVSLRLDTRFGQKHTSTVLTLDVGQAKVVQNLTMTLIAASVPPTPVLDQCFLRHGSRIALAPCNNREELVAGRIGEIQCNSEQEAQDITHACQALQSLITAQIDTGGIRCSSQLTDPANILNEQPLPVKLENGMLLGDQGSVRYDTDKSSLMEIQLSAKDLQLTAEIQDGHCEAHFVKIEGCYSCLSGSSLVIQANSDTPTPLTATLECDNHRLYAQFVITNQSTYFTKIVQLDTPEVNIPCQFKCPLNQVSLMITGHLHYLGNPVVANNLQISSHPPVTSGTLDFHWISILGNSLSTWIIRGTVCTVIILVTVLILFISFRSALTKRD